MIALGLDLGTSSVKALLCGPGILREESCAYLSDAPADMLETVARVCERLNAYFPLRRVGSVGLSGRTGTYAYLDKNGTPGPWMEWYAPGREESLKKLLAAFSPAEFQDMIAMPHPRLASYPLPMLMSEPPRGGRLVQPKDALMQMLTGRCLSDAGSWRGLYHPGRNAYSGALLTWAGVSPRELPEIAPSAPLLPEIARRLGLCGGIPVYTGMNDFYSALYGMGIDGPGMGFDVTGTSEHVGLTRLNPGSSPLITSPYAGGYVHYGVTASSGPSLSWGRSRFGQKEPEIRLHAPLFLPYLQGERAPVFDASARGMFVGITPKTDTEDLLYSVYEGVAFSLKNIQDALGETMPPLLRITGGAAASDLLCRLKASLLGCRVQRERLRCGSAMGAVRCAGGEWQREWEEFDPEETLTDGLQSRYRVYARLYSAWREAVAEEDTARLFDKE